MKKLYIIVLFLMTGIMAEAQTSVWDGSRELWTRGEGSESSPYRIESAGNLAFLAYMVNKGYETEGLYFVLTTDIDLNGSEDLQWVSVGLGDRWFNDDGCDRGAPDSYYNVNTYFRGHFDGGGHKIYNLYNDGGIIAGLFGYVTSEAEIKNVSVENGYIRDAQYGGGIVGHAGSGANVSITNCSNNADISGFQVGGIVGYGGGKVTNCYNTGSIKGTNAAGGISGTVTAEIHNCFNTGNITSYGGGGGIMGTNQRTTTIMNCYNTGSVTGDGQGIGGIGGIIVKGMVKNCYNVGDVANSQKPAGGVIGSDFNGTADNLYYLNTCGGEGLGEPMTDTEMRDPAFVGTLNNDTDVWGYDEGEVNDGYPILIPIGFSIDEITIQNEMLSVYPNPAKGSFTVEGTGRLSIIHLLGQVIVEEVIEGQTTVTLPKGIYLLRLTDGNLTLSRKVVVY